ncbi:hypothetical protein HYQ44_013051 [Verticillium longisporum]|nr:hypothetical protein HYQ44_013051 [Verticillium longisporum]
MSDTQRIFTTSWWTGGDLGGATPPRRVLAGPAPDARGNQQGRRGRQTQQRQHQQPLLARLRARWLPASFVRFVWFCLALLVGLMALQLYHERLNKRIDCPKRKAIHMSNPSLHRPPSLSVPQYRPFAG